MNIYLLYDSEILHSKYLLKKSENVCVQNGLYKNGSNLSHNGQNLETAQISIDKRMDKQIVVYPDNGILFSKTKEQTTD